MSWLGVPLLTHLQEPSYRIRHAYVQLSGVTRRGANDVIICREKDIYSGLFCTGDFASHSSRPP